MTDELVVTLFAGPGGCCTGARWAGWTGRNVGYDHDAAACATAEAAGHERVQADVAALDPVELHGDDDVVGMAATPPCPSFSTAGQGAGRKLIAILAEAITDAAHGRYDRRATVRRCARVLLATAHAASQLVGFRTPAAQRWAWALRQAEMSALVVEPMRWAYALRPRFIVLEQVPPVLVLWQHMAIHLRGMGYSVWTGVLDAEMYGVPQTRDRAILSADLDATVSAPEPTHQRYRPGKAAQTEPDLFGDPLPPPVSMAEALGWGLPERPAWTVSGGGTDTGGAEVFANAGNRRRLAETVLSPSTSSIGNDRTIPRRLHEPATTVAFGHSQMRWCTGAQHDPNARPAPIVLDQFDAAGRATRPTEVVRVTVAEAGVLQSFPPDYPWRGTKTQQYRQVGDAVPPLLFMHIVQPRLAVARERAA